MNQIKAVIFDLDGTLANTLPLCILAFRQAIEPLVNRSVSDEEIIATFGPSEEGTIMALAPDHYHQGIADYLESYRAMHNICAEPFEGIPALLTTLANNSVRIAMVTGKGKHSTIISLDYFGITNFFEQIETGSPNGPRKTEGIQLIMEEWNELAKTEIMYVGDAPSDIEASRAAGIPVVAAAWAATAEPQKLLVAKPDEIFYEVSSFAEWLRIKTGIGTMATN